MTSTPASAPISPASAQPSVSIRPTLIPSSRETAGLKAVARSRSPIEVQAKIAYKPAAAASTATAMKMSLRVTPSQPEPALSPTIENANATIDKTNALAGHLDQVVVENRKEIHDSLLQLQTSLADAQRMIGDFDETLNNNRGNLDETLENIRVSSQNLKQFTDTVKQKPFSLIRIKAQKDRLPPTGK